MINISSHYVRVAIKSAERKGLSSENILNAVGINANLLNGIENNITSEQFCKLWQYLWTELDDEFLGFTHKGSKQGTFALTCKVACQTSSIQRLFREVNRIYTLMDSDLVVSIENLEDNTVALQLNNRTPEYDIDHFVTEYFLFHWHRLACWVSDTKIKPLRAQFSYPEPSHSQLYKELFQCPVIFNAHSSALIFQQDFLDLSPIRSRREIYQFLKRLPADFMSLPGKDSSLETQIKLLIMENSKQQLTFPSMERLAEQLHISRTSLARKLTAENTSWRQLKESIRRDLTMEKLILTNITVTDIALQVGFLESTSLNRAFKNWTGMTPQQFRATRQ